MSPIQSRPPGTTVAVGTSVNLIVATPEIVTVPSVVGLGTEEATSVIVGAGPCGSLLAIYLARAGHDVVVYESRPDIRMAEIPAWRETAPKL